MKTIYMRELGAGIQRILDESSKLGIPTAEEERALIIRSQEGDRDAINELALRNARLITKHLRRYTCDAVHPDDAFCAGFLGLIRAAEKSDIVKWDIQYAKMDEFWRNSYKPSPFYVYAQHWIEVMMRDNMFVNETQVSRGPRQYSHKTRPETAAMQVGARYGFSVDKVLDSQARGREYVFGNEAAQKMGEISSALSFSPPDNETAMDTVAIKRIARRILSVREYDIVFRYMGFGTGEPLTLDQLSAKWGVCKERIRQIKEEALDRIRKELGDEVSLVP